MKHGISLHTLCRLALVLVAVLTETYTASAQDAAADYSDYLDYISVPAVPAKAIEPIRKHVSDLKGVIARTVPAVTIDRDGMALHWDIPCSDLFAPNDTVMMRGKAAALDILRDMVQYPTMYKVVVGVFTDDTGDDLYRETITEARAQAISDYLYGKAPVDNPNITVFAIPEGGELESNNSIAGRAANRRVEVRVVPEWQMIDMAKSGKLRR